MSQVQQVGFVGKLTDLRIYAGMDTLRESVVRKKTGISLFCVQFLCFIACRLQNDDKTYIARTDGV